MNPQGATEFEPSIEWVNEDNCDTLLVYLPGFAKEQLRVQLRSRTLIISGQRRLHDNKLSQFRKEIHVAEQCDLNKISAKFEGSILYVKLQKSTTPDAKQEAKAPVNAPAPVPKTPVDEPKVHQEVNPDSKPTSLTQPNRKTKEKVGEVKDPKGVRENASKNAPVPVPETPVDEPNVHEEVNPDSKPASLTQSNEKKDGNSEEKVGDLKDPKGVYENASKKTGSGSGRVMKMRPSRNDLIKVLVLVVGFVVGVYWTKSIQSWIG